MAYGLLGVINTDLLSPHEPPSSMTHKSPSPTQNADTKAKISDLQQCGYSLSELPKIRGNISGVSIVWIIAFWGIRWGHSLGKPTFRHRQGWPSSPISLELTQRCVLASGVYISLFHVDIGVHFRA